MRSRPLLCDSWTRQRSIPALASTGNTSCGDWNFRPLVCIYKKLTKHHKYGSEEDKYILTSRPVLKYKTHMWGSTAASLGRGEDPSPLLMWGTANTCDLHQLQKMTTLLFLSYWELNTEICIELHHRPFFIFWVRVLPSCLSWAQIYNPPASAFQSVGITGMSQLLLSCVLFSFLFLPNENIVQGPGI